MRLFLLTNLLPLLFFIFFSFTCNAQDLNRSVLPVAGSIGQGLNGTTLSWTLGETSTTNLLKDAHLSEGFQQGIITRSTTYRTETTSTPKLQQTENELLNVQLSLFPSLVNDQFTIQIERQGNQWPSEELNVQIVNAQGQFIRAINLQLSAAASVRTTIDQLAFLPSGIYFLQIKHKQFVLNQQAFFKD